MFPSRSARRADAERVVTDMVQRNCGDAGGRMRAAQLALRAAQER
jgi:hypothetical protein